MSDHPHAGRVDPLDRIVEALVDQSSPDGPDDEVQQRLLAAVEQLSGEGRAMAAPRKVGRPAVRMVARYAAIAAMIVLALFAATEMSRRGSRGPGAAFAAMVQRVQQVRTASFVLVMETKDGPTVESENLMMEPAWHYHHVTHDDREFIQIMNMQEGKSLSLFVAEKQASLMEITGRPVGAEQKDFIDEFRRMTEEGAQYEGRETINGVAALKYRYDKSGDHYVIWLDETSNLPVQVVATDVGEEAESSAKMTMTNFRWDIDVDQSLFSLEVPEGYELIDETTVDVGDVDAEGNFVAMMRFTCRLNDDQFPDELNAMSIITLVTRQTRAPEGVDESEQRRMFMDKIVYATGRADLPDMSREDVAQFAMRELAPLFGGGVAYMETTKQTHEWHYQGQGVRLGDRDAVVAWWHPKLEAAAESEGTLDAGVAEVMYGDLRIERMPVADIPGRTEEAEPEEAEPEEAEPEEE